MDLQALGNDLEDRRKRLALTREALAQGVGVSANYVWMVERAKPRAHGEPSQPSREVLERWVRLLWDEERDQSEIRKTLALAGYATAYVPAERARRSMAEGAPPSIQSSREITTQSLLRSLAATAQHIEQADQRLREARALLAELLASDPG